MASREIGGHREAAEVEGDLKASGIEIWRKKC